MLRTTLKNLMAHKFRLFATALAVILGVAFMSGTLILGDTVQKTFDDLFSDRFAGTDSVVRAQGSFEDPNGAAEQRSRIDDSLVGVVSGVDGVQAAEGQVLGYAQIIDKDGDAVGDPNFGAPTYGSNWSNVDELNGWELVEGLAPSGANEVVIDKQSADDTGYQVGDTIEVLVKGPPQKVAVAGIAKFGSADSPGGATFVQFTLADAQKYVAEPGKLDSIGVVGDSGLSQTEVTQRVSAALPANTEAVTGEVVTKENQDSTKEGLAFINTFFLIFAVVALLVGAFIIFNTFFITVAQRTRENALLRALGAQKRQVLNSVLIEAFFVGLVASVIGLALGVVVASGLQALLSGFGLEIPSGGVVFSPRTAIISLIAGLGITMLAAISPARKAGKVAPVAAMREVATGSTGYGSKQRVIIGVGVLGLGLAALLMGLFGNSDNPAPLVGLGSLFVFLGVAVLGRTIALPLSRFIGAPLPRLFGIRGQIARENAMRNPKRTAATAAALMIGVGLVAFITIFAASTKASFNKTIDTAFRGDYVITSPAGFGEGGLDPELAAQLNALPEVASAGGIRGGFADIDGGVKDVLAVSPEAFDVFNVDPVSGTPADLGASSIAIFKDVAEEKHLSVGDTVPVVFKDSGSQELTVGMIYGEDQPFGDWLLGTETYDANFADHYDFQIFVQKAPDADSATALTAIERVADTYPGSDVLDQGAYKADQTQFVDTLLGLVYVLLALAIIIALLGIGNTLVLSIIERTRELGMMRAVGMTRGQLRSTVRWESVIVALQGTALGLLIGLFFGWGLVTALSDEGVNTLSIPIKTLVIIVVLAGIAGVLAAVFPARRAAKLDILKAVATE